MLEIAKSFGKCNRFRCDCVLFYFGVFFNLQGPQWVGESCRNTYFSLRPYFTTYMNPFMSRHLIILEAMICS